jgi:hypothetical protein
MLRRFLDALHRDLADQVPQRQFRPNELSWEVARAERLRREARQSETVRRPDAPKEDAPPRRDRQPADPIPRPHTAPLTASLRSRSELRRALLLKEILGPPAALRWPSDKNPAS